MFIYSTLIALTMNAASYHTYFTMNSHGSILPETEQYMPKNEEYDMTINYCVIDKNREYIGTSISFRCLPDHEYEVYRLHGNGTHKLDDEENPLWNMKLQPDINPKWCLYNDEYTDGHRVIDFIDTFKIDLITNENPQANTLKYLIKDKTANHDFAVWIKNAMYYAIHSSSDLVTGVNDIHNDNDEIIYYDLVGHSSNYPFNGFNIVKNNGKYEKRIIKY